ncbi:MAG: 4-alpha-glucanotransferase [Rhodothermia bacterium]|nr:MAG: 4-alpha-glucanotransferase [Rhodothermia bacterium]
MRKAKTSGILLHITSLPSDFGIGDLGKNAFEFVDFLSESGQSLWQILPTVPIGSGFSPYMSPSTFAGNPLLICPEKVLDMDLIRSEDLGDHSGNEQPFENDRVDYRRVATFKKNLLQKAFSTFERDAGGEDRSRFEAWCVKENTWLDDYALFETLKSVFPGRSWTSWSMDLVKRDKDALERTRDEHALEYNRIRFEQFLFAQQWEALRSYANSNGISLVGDLPIYVAQESADVWSNRELFQLGHLGQPVVVAGVPPDYFSETGQYWGNPIYDWEAVKQTGYDWWIRRLGCVLNLVDLVRLDHFRGFEAYWEVPASEDTAINGRWVKGPGSDLFRALKTHFGTIPIIAENLGVMTEEVAALMTEFDFPGMAILQFALDGEMGREYLPRNLKEDLVAYTGTHDNDTFLGWWQNRDEERDLLEMNQIRAFASMHLKLEGQPESEIPWKGIEALMASDARTVIVPIQDVLGLPTHARMNTPGTSEGNWEWRLKRGQIQSEQIHRLRELTSTYGRNVTP